MILIYLVMLEICQIKLVTTKLWGEIKTKLWIDKTSNFGQQHWISYHFDFIQWIKISTFNWYVRKSMILSTLRLCTKFDGYFASILNNCFKWWINKNTVTLNCCKTLFCVPLFNQQESCPYYDLNLTAIITLKHLASSLTLNVLTAIKDYSPKVV